MMIVMMSLVEMGVPTHKDHIFCVQFSCGNCRKHEKKLFLETVHVLDVRKNCQYSVTAIILYRLHTKILPGMYVPMKIPVL